MLPEIPDVPATPKNAAAARTLQVLSAFRSSPHEFGVTQLSQMTGLDKSVVHRILDTLVSYEFLRQDPETRRYAVGLRSWEVGRHGETATNRMVTTVARGMQAITMDLGCTGYVACQRGDDAVYLAVVNGSGALRVHVEVGTTTWLPDTAMGMAILAQLQDDDETLVRVRRRMAATQRETSGRVRDIDAEITEIRSTKVAITRGVHNPGIGAVGVGLGRAVDGPVMAVSAAFPMVPGYLHLFDTLQPRLLSLAANATRPEMNLSGA